jgi:hypothetical protein
VQKCDRFTDISPILNLRKMRFVDIWHLMEVDLCVYSVLVEKTGAKGRLGKP